MNVNDMALYLSQPRFTEAHGAAVSEFLRRPEEIDWKLFLFQVKYHRTYPLVHRNVSRHVGFDKLPARVAKLLTMLRHKLLLRNERNREHIAAVLAALNSAGIEPTIWKGAFLFEAVYPCIDMREFADVDLIIDLEEYGAAKASLAGIGYSPFRTRAYEETVLRSDFGEIEFRNPDRLSVDIHWELSQAMMFHITNTYSYRAIKKRSVPAEYLGARVRFMSPEDILMSSAIHLSCKHFFGMFVYYLDLYYTIEKYGSGIDWDRLVKEAGRRKLSKLMYYVLHYLTRSVGPDSIKPHVEKLKRFPEIPGERRWFESVASPAACISYNPSHEFELAGKNKKIGAMKQAFRLLSGKEISGELEEFFQGYVVGFDRWYLSQIALTEKPADRLRLVARYAFPGAVDLSLLYMNYERWIDPLALSLIHFCAVTVYQNPAGIRRWMQAAGSRRGEAAPA